MFELNVTPDLLVSVFAAALAILFDWFPPIAQRYDSLSTLQKKQVMAVGLLLIVAVIYAGACTNIFAGSITCNKVGITSLVNAILVAMGINQGTHFLTKPVKELPA